jgi:putative polyhydroxyalkanoate system protein
MATIRIDRKHTLTHASARSAAERLARDLKQRFQLQYAWDGDDVLFERPGVTGHMHVGTSRITLDVTLGFLLSALKPTIEREIHAQLDKVVPADVA